MRCAPVLVLLVLACSGGSSSSDAGTALDVGSEADASTASYACDPSVGLVEPLAVCSASEPCTRLIATAGSTPITTPSEVPTCTASAARGGFSDGAPRTYVDADGVTRYACVYVPPSATSTTRVPLVLFWHGAGAHADDVYTGTSLRMRAPSYDLTGDAARTGFALVSIQGRNLHWPTLDPRDGAHHDQFHRDFGVPSTNRDVALADAIVDDLVGSQPIDPARIYVMGWSNGGFFAQLYAIARHDTPTAGGHYVAAASVFTAADPFRSPRLEDAGRCDFAPPGTTVPIRIVSRACDIIACDEAQLTDLVASDAYVAPPGVVVGTWVARLGSELHDPDVEWDIVTGTGASTTACTGPALCGLGTATLNHVHWPDGVADGSGMDHEPAMLDWLRMHPML